MSFSKIDEVISMPNLIEVQKKSYKWFIEEGLKQVFEEMSTITDYTENLEVQFTTDYRLDDTPKYNVIECKARDATYSVPLRVKVRLLNKETGEIKENEVFLGEIPLMTESGTFVINGAERAVVSQLVRSPSCYFEFDDTVRPSRMVLRSTIIPNRGAWIECEADATEPIDKEPVYVKIDKNRRFPLSTFLRALGYFSGVAEEERGKIAEGSGNEFLWATGTFVPFPLEKNADIDNIIGIDERLGATYEKDTTQTSDEAIVEVYKKLRPGEPATVEGSAAYLRQLLFDAHRYEISRVGRYKYNKKLSISDRLAGRVLAADAVSAMTGEILASKGDKLDRAKARELEAKGVTEAYIVLEEHNDREFKVLSNSMVDIEGFVSKKVYDKIKDVIGEKVSIPVLKEILEGSEDDKALIGNIIENADFLMPKHITVYDILASVNYFLGLPMGVGKDDDIDHLGNRRIRSVGELLQNQFRIGFARMERSIREKLSLMSNDPDNITPLTLINARPVGAAIKEFFGSSPLSQFMDQTNPLSELTHKRRLSALGPGGLSRDRASFEVRDVHYTHYGRMCPIETPEGPNIGLISYLATFAKINDYGFIEAPFRRIDKKTGKVLEEVIYMTAGEEDDYIVAQANEPLDENGKFLHPKVNARYQDRFMEVPAEKADFMDVSPKMVVSVATAMIPFLENDDTNRALMGSNMQKQAVPLLKTENPIVGTGMEYKAAVDSGVVVLAKEAGEVVRVSADKVSIKEKGGEIRDYELIKFLRSNHGTCI
ncbi:MAG: DNA-directed RNA polymerase subunit beta, partial [Oscillospiraceae bacterium]|nr:DNA-directed RNA polymerase subunit beta [Candidatus Equicaccousia limihippi]